VAILAAVACAYDVPEGEGIYRLNYSNLTMAAEGDWLLILYAPWCPHCHSLLDKLHDLVAAIKKAEGNVKIGVIDADSEPAIQMQFSMHGFPTLFMVHDGVTYQHPMEIGRSVEALTKWSTKDYANAEPMTGLKAPFGIPMRAFAAYSNFAILAYRFLETYANQLGVPAMWFFYGVAFVLAVVVIIILIIVSRCRRSGKKNTAHHKNSGASKKKDAEIVAPIVEQARAENPIEGAAVAGTEKVQEKVKKAKEEEKLRRRHMSEDQAAAREQQKQSQKKQSKGPKTVRQQTKPVQQPSKRS